MSDRLVYFAHATNGGPIKLGATKFLQGRIKALGSCIPGGMEVIATIPGHFRREAYLKCALKPWQVQGEWLKSCPEVWRVILECLSAGDLHWVPADEIRSVEKWQQDFNHYATTPGFRYIDNGPVGKTLFGRAQFAYDLYHGRLPAWIVEAHRLSADEDSLMPRVPEQAGAA